MLQQIGRYKEDFETNNDDNKFTFVEISVTMSKLESPFQIVLQNSDSWKHSLKALHQLDYKQKLLLMKLRRKPE